MLFGVGVSCRILYSIASYLYVSCNGSITSVEEERGNTASKENVQLFTYINYVKVHLLA